MVHNGWDVDRRLPSTLFSSPSILASPIRESVFKLCVSRMFITLRAGTAAALHGRAGSALRTTAVQASASSVMGCLCSQGRKAADVEMHNCREA